MHKSELINNPTLVTHVTHVNKVYELKLGTTGKGVLIPSKSNSKVDLTSSYNRESIELQYHM